MEITPIEYASLAALVLSLIVALRFWSQLSKEREKSVRLEALNERIPKLEEDFDALRSENNHFQNAARVLEGDLREKMSIASEVPNLKDMIRKADDQIKLLMSENARLQKTIENDDEKLQLMREAREELSNNFDTLSKRALTQNSQSFLDLARESLSKYQESAKGDLEKRQQAISELVTPLHTKLREFEQKVDEVYRTEAAERNSLRGEIKNLVELNQQISREASNLALALKGDTKKQGNWGELILEKVLEFSGLRKDQEYKLQVSLRDDHGARLQPDAIIYLPESKHIIVDAKVSLVAYDRFVSSQSDDERSAALLDHVASVKRHIKELSDKDYSSLAELDSPDFTLLFMPIESSFGLAIQADNELFAYAWDRKIVIVSPSTLLATLRTISSIWKQERQTRNALEIADRAGKMYDKFVGFFDDLTVVGKKMDDAKSGYVEAMKKLSTGPGNLVRQSEQLKDMGAKATKQLPSRILDRAVETTEPEPDPLFAASSGGELMN